MRRDFNKKERDNAQRQKTYSDDSKIKGRERNEKEENIKGEKKREMKQKGRDRKIDGNECCDTICDSRPTQPCQH